MFPPNLVMCSTLIHPIRKFSSSLYFEEGFLNLPGIVSKFHNPLSVFFNYNNSFIYGSSHFAFIQRDNDIPALFIGTQLSDRHYQLLTLGHNEELNVRIQTIMEKRYESLFGKLIECHNLEYTNALTSFLVPYFDEYKKLDL